MRKVYIVNRGCHDHSDAERFGELVFLSEGSINRFAVARIYREFIDAMSESGPEDYILITGLSVMSSIACAIFSRKHGQVNLLLFKATRNPQEKGCYIERVLMIDELLEHS